MGKGLDVKQVYEVMMENRYKDFLVAYRGIREWEGNYANLEFDKGGETYGGIARNFNKKWEGWETIDDHKFWNTVKWNDSIPSVETQVEEYYWNIWNRDMYYLIKEPLVRNYMFDYQNSGPVAYKHMKYVLNYHGYKVGNSANMDIKSIHALNTINPLIFVLHLKEVHMDFYTRVADRNPDLKIYLRGWLRRAQDIV
jgi:lysozyme family protein